MKTAYWAILPAFCFLYGCTTCQGPVAGVHVDTKLSRFVPPEATVLAGIDVARVKTAPVYQRHSEAWNVPIVNGAAERIGLDPRRDIATVIVAMVAKQPVALVRGSFSVPTVEQKLLAMGAHKQKYEGEDVFSNGQQAVYFPSAGVAVVAQAPAINRIIDLHGSGSPPDSLKARLRELKDDQVWLVSDEGLPANRFPMPGGGFFSAAANIAGFVNGASAGVMLDDGLHINAELTCVSNQGAQQVQDALRGLIAIGRLSTKDGDRAMLQMYDAFKVDQNESKVELRADLSAQLSDQLIALLPRAAR